MKIIKIQTLRGANIWSSYRKNLIQMRLDLEELEHYPTNLIPGFKSRLEQLMPSLIAHECSEGVHGGFFIRVNEGTWMGHVIEHIALELQTLAGMDTGYGRTRSTNTPGVYNVIFSYIDEEAGIYAANASVKIAEALIAGNEYDLEKDILALKDIYVNNKLGPSTASIVEEAVQRGIPWMRLGDDSRIQLGYGANQMRFQATMTCKTSSMAVDIACDKDKTKRVLSNACIPVPNGEICSSSDELDAAIESLGFPLVVKPLDANQGKGATINISSREEALSAFSYAKTYSDDVIVERYIAGYDFRLLVIDNKFVAAAKRVPAHVTGDGKSTINELIEITNTDPRRGDGHDNVLTRIIPDADTYGMLGKMSYTLETIPRLNEIVYLKSTANLSTGGTSVDVTDAIHPDNIVLAESVARLIGLDICGIDVMATTIATPLRQNGGAVIEVNAAPGFRMHLAPGEGQPRNVAAPVVDMLFPKGKDSRIPIVSVTGTNGKTTTTRLIAHIAQTSGLTTGFTTTDGTYINKVLHEKGDNTGPQSAQYILRDPSVEFAVLETARGGILRAGLGFDKCDVGVITNIQEDHLGLNDINSLDDLAKVKGVVVQNVKPEGWAIVNADDKKCISIAEELECKRGYFSIASNINALEKLHDNGAAIAYCEQGYITIKLEGKKIRIAQIGAVPLTQNGKAKFMVANVLAASLSAYLSGFDVNTIAEGLQSFEPGYENTPGRMNLFEFNTFRVLVDYAHNPDGYRGIEEYLSDTTATRKIGIISGVGDRRDSDIVECAAISARMFDHIIIRNESDLRGRTEEDINNLLLRGVREVSNNVSCDIVQDEFDAMRYALSIAAEGDFIIALTDQIDGVVAIINEALESEKQHNTQLIRSA
jgi:cyanophycin synthetase